MSADEAAPDGCPECGCGSHWRVHGALCRDCGHAAHAGVPRRRRPRVKVEPDRQGAIPLGVGAALLLFCAGGPEYRLPGGGSAQELARESTQALGGFTGLLAGLAAVLALRE